MEWYSTELTSLLLRRKQPTSVIGEAGVTVASKDIHWIAKPTDLSKEAEGWYHEPVNKLNMDGSVEFCLFCDSFSISSE